MNPSLNIIEIFHSIQGESSLVGIPTTFIRLAACNLRCSWCDTTYSFGRGTPFLTSNIIKEVQKGGLSFVCITGGEPLLQKDVYSLMTQLLDLGITVSLETSGSLSTQEVDPRVRVILDVKCPGSKMSDKNYWKNLEFLKSGDEVKFVLVDRSDYDYAVRICNQYGLFQKNHEILFSPAFSLLQAAVLAAWIVEDKIPVRLQLQMHKFIWSPQTRGV